MKKYTGEFIMATAMLHTIVGFMFGGQPLLDIVRSGLFNAVDPHFDRMAIVWYLLFGVLLFSIGALVRWMQRETGRLPGWLSWFFWIFAVPNVILMPISGFWLLFPLGWLARQRPA